MVVEGEIPPLVDILCMGDMHLIVLIERAVVGEQCIGVLHLIEGKVVGRFVQTRIDIGLVDKPWRGLERGEEGEVRMPQFGNGEEIVAIEGIETVGELRSGRSQGGMADIHNLHLDGRTLEHED